MKSSKESLEKMLKYLKIEGDYKKLDEEHPYKVNDLIGYIGMKDIDSNKLNIKDLEEKDKVIFILESPHTNEIKEKKPAVGNTGKKFLTNGKAVGNEIDEKNENKNIAILNISNIPLQIEAVLTNVESKMDEYDTGVCKSEIQRLQKFNKYKRKSDLNKTECKLFNEIIDYLVNDFRKRLDDTITEFCPTKIIALGKGAENVLDEIYSIRMVKMGTKYISIEETKHPSRS